MGKIEITEEQLRELYIEQNKSMRDIAAMFNTSARTIANKCQNYGIKKDKESMFDCRTKHTKATCLERYGTEVPAQNEAVKEKIKQTCIKKYGCDSPFQNDDVKKKIAQSVFEKYGCENPFQSQEVKEKTKQTLLKKYGCEYISQNKEIRDRVNATFLEKYGYGHISQKHLSKESVNIVASEESLRNFIQTNGVVTVTELCELLGYHRPRMLLILHKFGLYDLLDHNESSPEQEVRDFIDSLGIENYRDRSVLEGREIDIYCPAYKIGIEFNGIYWHSSLYKKRDYHYKKSLEAEAKGVRLIHIYENEWLDPRTQPIIKSLLSLAFGKIETRIYARQCEVREITNAEACDFVNENHIQGHRNAKVTLGLFHKNELVQLMSFSHNKDYEWEIIRSCPKMNVSVVGGISKLYNHFKKLYDPKEIFSYADFNKFDGHGYATLGMELIGYTGPDMKWIIDGEVYNRNPLKNAELKEIAEAQLFGAGSKKFLWKAN